MQKRLAIRRDRQPFLRCDFAAVGPKPPRAGLQPGFPPWAGPVRPVAGPPSSPLLQPVFPLISPPRRHCRDGEAPLSRGGGSYFEGLSSAAHRQPGRRTKRTSRRYRRLVLLYLNCAAVARRRRWRGGRRPCPRRPRRRSGRIFRLAAAARGGRADKRRSPALPGQSG